jgi:hypothetical protein
MFTMYLDVYSFDRLASSVPGCVFTNAPHYPLTSPASLPQLNIFGATTPASLPSKLYRWMKILDNSHVQIVTGTSP